MNVVTCRRKGNEVSIFIGFEMQCRPVRSHPPQGTRHAPLLGLQHFRLFARKREYDWFNLSYAHSGHSESRWALG
jgi:hypothetical protein